MLNAFEIFWNLNAKNSEGIEFLESPEEDIPFAIKQGSEYQGDVLAIKPDYVDRILDFCAKINPKFLCDKVSKPVLKDDEEVCELIKSQEHKGLAKDWT